MAALLLPVVACAVCCAPLILAAAGAAGATSLAFLAGAPAALFGFGVALSLLLLAAWLMRRRRAAQELPGPLLQTTDLTRR